MRALLLLALLLAGLLAAQPARAATTCSAVVDAALPFGTISNAAAGPSNATLNIRITCNTLALALLANAAVRVCVGIGNGDGGTTTTPWRTMVNGNGDTMNFQLYNDTGYSQITGLTPNGTPPAKELTLVYSVPALVGGSGVVTTQLSAQIPANQTLASGNYSRTFSGANVVLNWAYGETIIGNATMPSTCLAGVSGTGSASGVGTFTATANVLPQCGSYLTTDLDFGTVAGGISSNIDRTATLTLTCLRRTAYQISLDNGQNSLGTVRRMRTTINNSNYYLTYELYRDSNRSQRWGNTLNVDTYGNTGTGSAQQVTVYGRVSPVTGQPPAGTYTDRVQVTITY
ncbi:spore coat U domain-containing protein [Stenotrophomonas sp. 24(2023)]|uniref:Csu type fimbrial protein n=1 Tax=Stenotrophomonas sp. 24(2023) TaxID=3068324 RepID=UPI0027DF81C1|nr:spore coat U domain-containing protein [Stenotrophomonas sp. 24(2023)]WMJ68503.1 spore coat U domain-containing protein [Stenotrophomonas sp. 24(2023)]